MANLTKIPTREEIHNVMDVLIEKKFINWNKDTELFDEYSLISNCITPQKVTVCNTGNISTENRWVELFKHFHTNNLNLNHTNFCIIIEYILCLPGTNAPVERVFSLMNKLWTSKKTQLQVAVLKAMLITKVNFKKPCREFHSYLKSTPNILKQIYSSKIYRISDVLFKQTYFKKNKGK